MSLTRIPLPSIALVLMSDPDILPLRPSVIKFEFDPLQTIYPTSSGHSRVLDPTGAQIVPACVQTDPPGNPPAVNERFFFVNVSLTDIGCSDEEPLDGGSDAPTMFAKERPTTSRGSMSKGLTNDIVFRDNFMTFASSLRSLLRFKPKGSPMNKCT